MPATRSLAVYHLHMGGPDGDAAPCQALYAPRFMARLNEMGVRFVDSAASADVMLVSGLLLGGNLEATLREIASLPQPSRIILVGDAAINGGQWAKLEMPGLAPHPLSYYADIPTRVPGDPPAPQDVIAAITNSGGNGD